MKRSSPLPPRGCRVRVDRVKLIRKKGKRKIRYRPPVLPGFKVVSDWFVRQRGRKYARVRRYKNLQTGTQVFVQYRPVDPWMAPMRATIIANDQTGLQFKELQEIECALKCDLIVLLELAFDFEESSVVDLGFVRRHALFGKSRPRPSVRPLEIAYYGGRLAAKLVRCYGKRNLGVFRVELEFHRPCLKKYYITDSGNIWARVDEMVERHLRFVRLDWDALAAHLTHLGLSTRKIVRKARARAQSLHGVLHFLRHDIGINNPHRFLRSLKINRKVRRALNAWADSFTPPRRRF